MSRMCPLHETLRNRLAVFVHETEFSSLPEQVVNQAKFCLLDLVGVAIAGSLQPTSLLAREVFGTHAPPPEATLWTTEQKVSAATAAFLNAVQGHAIDMDDGHRYANGHPGVVTIPAALALAEYLGTGGRELVAAIVIGYEVFIRLGRAANPDLLQRGFHTTATIGTFAATAAAAKLLQLTVPQIENAFSLAGLQSAGLLEALSSGEMGKSFQVGRAVQGGVQAAMLAQKGADGPAKIFEGDKGFFKAFSGKQCDTETICGDLGDDFLITTVYFKRHAACRHVHSALDSIAEILLEHDLDRAAIESIEVETYSVAKNLTGHLATHGSELAAKFSMPIAIGLLLIFDRTDALAFTRENISDPRVHALAKKVSITASAARDAVYPGERGAEVRIRTQDNTYEKEVTFPKGEPECPLSFAELREKYETNAGLVYSVESRKKLQAVIMHVENIQASEITEILRGREPEG